MEGKFTLVEPSTKLAYTAKSWTEGQRDKSEIDQVAVLTLTNENGKTSMNLKVTLNKSGSGLLLAAFGMKYGYKQQFEKLAEFLAK
jgi:hypothetical protein